jgi:hypothetical protein
MTYDEDRVYNFLPKQIIMAALDKPGRARAASGSKRKRRGGV